MVEDRLYKYCIYLFVVMFVAVEFFIIYNTIVVGFGIF